MFEINDEMQTNVIDDIAISACPVLVEESTQGNLWGYYLCIENNSKHKIQLLGKNWNISDDKGNFYCDDSDGFKGEIPELEPGEYFEFTSTAPIDAHNAVFYGSCKIVDTYANKAKNIRIPTLSLATKYQRKNAILN